MRILRKRLVIGILLILVFGFLLAIYLDKRGDTDTSQDNEGTALNVKIEENQALESSLEPRDITDAQKLIKSRLEQNNVVRGDLTYKYREGSLISSTVNRNILKKDFIVDIPEIESSFVIQIEGDSSTEYRTIYVLCPTESQSIYKAQVCSDQQ